MRCTLHCNHCGQSIELDTPSDPKSCCLCGSRDIKVVYPITKARATALGYLDRARLLKPIVEMRYAECQTVRCEYEDAMQGVRQYFKRGHLSQEERDSATIAPHSSTNDLLKTYRKNK